MSTTQKFILATLRHPDLRLRHSLWVDITAEEKQYLAKARGLPFEARSGQPEEAVENLREDLKKMFFSLRERAGELEPEETRNYYLLNAHILVKDEESNRETVAEKLLPEELAHTFHLKQGVKLQVTCADGFWQATLGKSFLSGIGTTEKEAMANFCKVAEGMIEDFSDTQKRRDNPETWNLLRDLMENPPTV